MRYGYPLYPGYGYAAPYAPAYAPVPDPYGYGWVPETVPYGYGDPYGYYAETDPYAQYADYGNDPYGDIGLYDQPIDLDGYDQDEPFSQGDPDLGTGDDQGMSAYVPQDPSAFDAACGSPLNIAGVDQGDSLDGYVQPSVDTVCERFTTPSPNLSPLPETFRPIW